ncbi:MAG: RseA family anti-sigma factor [Gammaproteobacteria bacterium]|nr:RseA family anti-sigma factor [Gammaproteobacteria bacterium]
MDSIDEELSALMDDEHPATDAALSRLLAGNVEVHERWSRYHLLGEILRDANSAPEAQSLASRVHEQLNGEPFHLVPSPLNRNPNLWAPALAASLAALGVWGVITVAHGPERTAATPAVAVNVPPAPLHQPATRLETVYDNEPPTAGEAAAELRRRLNSYIVNFNEQRDSLAVPNVHPYVRIVGFDPGAPR